MYRTLGQTIILIIILISTFTNSSFSQDSGFTCHFSENLTASQLAILQEGAPILQDTTLRVAILFVQFADFATNADARGSVGWNDISPSASIIEKKYRYHHFWDMYFTKGTYIDTSTTDPEIHPDEFSHDALDLFTYGSLRDYYLEVSNGNLEVLPAVTHPAVTDTMFRSGIINRFDSTDGSINWATLSKTLADYNNAGSVDDVEDIMDDAIELAGDLFTAGSLDVDIDDTDKIDRVFIYAAGSATGGLASDVNGRYSIWRERAKATPTSTQYMNGFGGFAHELGHQIGYLDLNDQGDNTKPEGVGDYSIMGTGTGEGRTLRPTHVGAWEKLQSGWLDYELIESDKINYILEPVVDTTLVDTPEVAILFGSGVVPEPEKWTEAAQEYFILENRSTVGFDESLKLNDPNFLGGMITWHYSGYQDFANGHRIRVVEADITASLPEGNLGTTNTIYKDEGRTSDFFPGADNVTEIDDNTIPSLRLASGFYSHYRLGGISFNSTNSKIEIDSLLTKTLISEISQNTTWSQNTTLTKEVIIKNNATLTVNPGVVITIDPSLVKTLRIIVDDGGHLALNGTVEDPVIFKAVSDTGSSDWNGIVFNSGSTFDLSYVTIKNATYALDLRNLLAASLSYRTLRGLTIENCIRGFDTKQEPTNLRFADLTLRAIEDSLVLDGDDAELDSSYLTEATIEFRASPVLVKNCVIDSGKIRINTPHTQENFVEKNEFNRHGKVILLGVGETTIRNNLFLNGSQIKLQSVPAFVSPRVINNVFIGVNKQGEAIKNTASKMEVVNNTFLYYEYGYFSAADLPAIKFSNNIFYENDKTFVPSTSTSFTYNIVDNDDSPSGLDTTNILADPKFVDPVNGNVHLQSISQGIDAGHPDSSYSNEPSPNGGQINIGAYGNTIDATLTFDHILQTDLDNDATWSGHVNILESVSTNGSDLTISPGTKIFFDAGKSLTVTASLFADGLASLPGPDPIVFSGYRENDVMGGVYLYPESNDTLHLEYCHFKRSGTGLYVSDINGSHNTFDYLLFEDDTTGFYSKDSDLSITNSTFTSNETGMIVDEGDVTISSGSFNNNSVQGLHLYYADFDVSNSTFEDNLGRGVYFQYSSNGDFTDNTVRYNGSDPSESMLKGGIVCYQSSPIIKDNEITYNDANGILSLSSSYPTMTGDGYNLVAQNAGNSGSAAAEIFVQDISFPLLDRGTNDIADTTGGYLIYGDEDPRESLLYVRYNYWGETDSSSIAGKLHRPGGFVFYPFDLTSNTGSGLFSKEGNLAEADSIADFFERGLAAERNGKYADAVAHYDSLITLYPASAMSKPVMDRLYHVKLAKGDTPLQLQTYYSTFISHFDTALATVAQRLAIRSLTADGDYQDAITEHTTWSVNTPFESDSIYSQVDILSNQLRASGTPIGKMKAGKEKTKHLKKQQASFEETRIKTDALLSSLIRKGGDEEAAVIPEKFSLGQNYPNPFNPTTTITFQAPTKGNIQLEIFNVLGQKVKTLLNSDVDAGEYKLLWDSRNGSGNRVASGLYFYRAYFTDESGKQIVKSKKMILLR
ncbi:MAG: right-handed parallel beta-helix repeat-containing protein [Calditrichia bacterium]